MVLRVSLPPSGLTDGFEYQFLKPVPGHWSPLMWLTVALFLSRASPFSFPVLSIVIITAAGGKEDPPETCLPDFTDNLAPCFGSRTVPVYRWQHLKKSVFTMHLP